MHLQVWEEFGEAEGCEKHPGLRVSKEQGLRGKLKRWGWEVRIILSTYCVSSLHTIACIYCFIYLHQFYFILIYM